MIEAQFWLFTQITFHWNLEKFYDVDTAITSHFTGEETETKRS